MTLTARAVAGAAVATGVAALGWWGFESGASEDVARWNTALVSAVYAAFVTVALVAMCRRPADPRPPKLLAAATLLTVSYFRFLHSAWLSAIGAFVWLASPAVLLATFTEPLRRHGRVAVGRWSLALGVIAAVTTAVSGPDSDGQPPDALRAVSWTWFDFRLDRMVRQPNPVAIVTSDAMAVAMSAGWWAAVVAAGFAVARRISGVVWQALLWCAIAASLVLSIPVRLGGGPSLLDGPAGQPMIAAPIAICGVYAAWAVWAELITPRLMRPEVLVVQLDRDSTIDATRRRLARVLGDPSASIVFPSDGGWIDDAGRRQPDRPGRRHVEVTQDGATVAALDLDAFTPIMPDLLADAAGALAVSLEARRIAANSASAAAEAARNAQRLIDVERAAVEAISEQIEAGPAGTLARVDDLLNLRPLPLGQIHDEIRRSLEEVRAVAHRVHPSQRLAEEPT